MRAEAYRRLRVRRPGTRLCRFRPYLIDADEFDFIDDFELHDWMLGLPSKPTPAM